MWLCMVNNQAIILLQEKKYFVNPMQAILLIISNAMLRSCDISSSYNLFIYLIHLNFILILRDEIIVNILFCIGL